MQNKENMQVSMSPCHKKRVRICSLNNQKRKALTECTLDLNISPPSPSHQLCSSHKVLNLQKKRVLHTEAQQRDQSQHKKRLRIRSIKTEQVYEKSSSHDAMLNQNTNTNNSEQFDKLIQITNRCVDYYNKFIQIKNSELKVVKQAFSQIHDSLDRAFNGIIVEVQNKHKEIKHFLQKKQKQLAKIKQDQQAELNTNLSQVKSVHLIGLLTDYKAGEHSADLSEQICHYASTLHRFYEVMQKVERQNFKQGAEETINFINNVITEQIKFIIYQRIPSKSLNNSFSFNDGLGYGNSISSVAASKLQVGNSHYQSMAEENIDGNQQNSKKQYKQGWTQTLNQNLNPRESVLQMLNLITAKQSQMKNKIQCYRQSKK